MKSNKKEIHLPFGFTLDDAVIALLEAKERGESVYCNYNGCKLYSDTVSMDSAYMKITGKTKEEFDESYKKFKKQHDEERISEANIVKLFERGERLIFPERLEAWQECVEIQSNSIYNGAELTAALDIMEALENGATMDQASEILDGQNHSGTSAALVRAIVFHFSSKGPDFWEATQRSEMDFELKKTIEVKREENRQLLEAREQENRRR